MGAECIISGIRPQIAQTIVHLGVDLSDVITKATLADAFAIALAAQLGPRRSGPRPAASGRHGAHPDPQDGRLPAGHDPGRHARPARDDAAGRPHRIASRHARARGVLIDISALDVVDSFIGRMLGEHRGHGARARRADRSSSACGRRSRSRWSSSGSSLPGVRTALDVEKGMALIQGRAAAAGWQWPSSGMTRGPIAQRRGRRACVRQVVREWAIAAGLQPGRPDEDRHRRERAGAQHARSTAAAAPCGSRR